MITDKRLQANIDFCERFDGGEHEENDLWVISKELQTLRIDNERNIKALADADTEIHELEEQYETSQLVVGQNLTIIERLEQQNKALIEDAKFWYGVSDKYAIQNIPTMTEKSDQHNALMKEINE